jgi:hypothetical protein
MSDDFEAMIEFVKSKWGETHERALQIVGNHPDAVREEMEKDAKEKKKTQAEKPSSAKKS